LTAPKVCRGTIRHRSGCTKGRLSGRATSRGVVDVGCALTCKFFSVPRASQPDAGLAFLEPGLNCQRRRASAISRCIQNAACCMCCWPFPYLEDKPNASHVNLSRTYVRAAVGREHQPALPGHIYSVFDTVPHSNANGRHESVQKEAIQGNWCS